MSNEDSDIFRKDDFIRSASGAHQRQLLRESVMTCLIESLDKLEDVEKKIRTKGFSYKYQHEVASARLSVLSVLRGLEGEAREKNEANLLASYNVIKRGSEP